MAGWSPSDIRANLSSTGAGAGTATRNELGNKNLSALSNSFPVAITAVVAVKLRLALISLWDHPPTHLIGAIYELHWDQNG